MRKLLPKTISLSANLARGRATTRSRRSAAAAGMAALVVAATAACDATSAESRATAPSASASPSAAAKSVDKFASMQTGWTTADANDVFDSDGLHSHFSEEAIFAA